MATLQNIRSKGPLLVIVIGLALFAFIAGDAWKVLQPHQSVARFIFANFHVVGLLSCPKMEISLTLP